MAALIVLPAIVSLSAPSDRLFDQMGHRMFLQKCPFSRLQHPPCTSIATKPAEQLVSSKQVFRPCGTRARSDLFFEGSSTSFACQTCASCLPPDFSSSLRCATYSPPLASGRSLQSTLFHLSPLHESSHPLCSPPKLVLRPFRSSGLRSLGGGAAFAVSYS